MFWSLLITLLCIFITVRYFLRRLRIPGYKEKYVLVTGCDTGFGNTVARRLNEMGIYVIAGCLTEAGVKELNGIGSSNLLAVQLDITNDRQITEAVKKVEEVLPSNQGLWALVNNAGILGSTAMFDWLTKADYRKVMEVNLFGTVEMVNHFMPLLRMSKGRIIVTTSVAGRLGMLCIPAYISSKYALEGYSDVLRRQLETSKVSVHIVEPGVHRTPIMTPENTKGFLQQSFDKVSPEMKSFYGKEYPDQLYQRMFAHYDTFAEGQEPVVDAYIHAITSRYPKYRYVVGRVSNWMLWPLTWLPEFVGDFVARQYYPTPAAIQKQ